MEHTKQEHPPFFKSVRNYFREYCNCSSIHGFRYFGEKRTYFERGWWFVVFTATLVGCAIMIREVYQKWVRSPVIVSFATRETPIYKIPFPAVTICPESKSNKHYYNHTKIIRKLIEKQTLTEREQKLYDYMGLVCDGDDDLSYYEAHTSMDTVGNDFFEELDNITSFSPFLMCSYMGTRYYYSFCRLLFKPIITDEGICYTFNMLDRSEIYKDNVVHYKNFHVMENLSYKNWTMDNGYSEDVGLYPYPHRALLAGAKNAFTVHLLTPKRDIDQTCKQSIHGFRVVLHTPMRIPRPSVQYFRVPLNQVVLGAIQPVMITTSEAVKEYNAKRRECYFPWEKNLKYFKIYTSLNCKLECLTNFTLQYCKCVNYYMPRENTTKICGISKLDCLKEAEQFLEMGDLQQKIEKPSNKSVNGSNTDEYRYEKVPDCDCMPICSDLSYNAEISQNDWDWTSLAKSLAERNESLEEDEFNKFHLSSLTLFFKSSQFITSQRHELYGPTDFLANFGGLLGLFTGFSILSLMEALYFLTIRLCCNTRLYGYWAGPET